MTLKRLRQKDGKFEVSLGCIVKLNCRSKSKTQANKLTWEPEMVALEMVALEMVAYTCKSRAKGRRSKEQDQPGLYSKTLSQRQNKTRQSNTKNLDLGDLSSYTRTLARARAPTMAEEGV